MDAVSTVATIVVSMIGAGGIGHKLADWARDRDSRAAEVEREREARAAEAEREEERTARELLQDQVEELRREVDQVRAEMRAETELRTRNELKFRLRIQRLANKVRQLELERADLKEALEEAVERERALQELINPITEKGPASP